MPRSSPSAAIVELVRRVANDHVELHVVSKQLGDPSLDVVGVDERVGVGFKTFAAVEGLLAGSAVLALAIGDFVIGLPSSSAVSTNSVPPTQVCSHGSNQMLPSSVAKDLATECCPLAYFEQ